MRLQIERPGVILSLVADGDEGHQLENVREIERRHPEAAPEYPGRERPVLCLGFGHDMRGRPQTFANDGLCDRCRNLKKSQTKELEE